MNPSYAPSAAALECSLDADPFKKLLPGEIIIAESESRREPHRTDIVRKKSPQREKSKERRRESFRMGRAQRESKASN